MRFGTCYWWCIPCGMASFPNKDGLPCKNLFHEIAHSLEIIKKCTIHVQSMSLSNSGRKLGITSRSVISLCFSKGGVFYYVGGIVSVSLREFPEESMSGKGLKSEPRRIHMDEEQPNHELSRVFGPPPSCWSTTTFSVVVTFPFPFCLYYYHSIIVKAGGKEKLFWDNIVESELTLSYTISWWGEAIFGNRSFVLTKEGINWLSDRILDVPLETLMVNGERKIIKFSEIIKYMKE